MEEIIEILMRRDGISRDEAEEYLQDCVDELQDCIAEGGFLYQLEDIVAYNLGLEPDYLDVLLNEMI